MSRAEKLAAWADALEFGDYRQALGEYASPDGSFCALGVARVLYGTDATYAFGQQLGLTVTQLHQIIELNDYAGWSLPQIGVWIRDNWVKEQ